MIDSVFRAGSNYYPQVFLKGCKYVFKEKEVSNYIIDGTDISSDSDIKNSDEENSDKESFNEKNYDKKNSDEEN